ncbi:MAG: hypothetical protein ACJASQ_000026 [Crocinitomicaceae bacterium]|jgi:hypothetical protein
MYIETKVPENSIWIYVTDIETAVQMKVAAKTLNAESSILKWSVDTEDRDNVLRVVSNHLEEHQIQRRLERQGLNCRPMID